SVEPGEWITAGIPLAKAGDYRTLIVPVALSPKELHSLQSTPTVPLILPGNKQTGAGYIYRISPEFDPTTRKTKVDIALSPETLATLPRKRGGLRLEIPLTLPDPMQAFMVPVNAVEERYEENWLTRNNGDRLRVIVLGPALSPDKDDRPWLRITSPEITEGDIFLLTPGP
ncbi:MAG: HlyD family efflux transporter periplasmic adaptor subunit, partial [Desulfobulbaceae bacterium]|nr:HlyD family efflux transporter periplasmic adaptor subunit [Desulfobulbaceae bacterium]